MDALWMLVCIGLAMTLLFGFGWARDRIAQAWYAYRRYRRGE